jgi:proline racemase
MATRQCLAAVAILACATATLGGCTDLLTEGTSAGAGIAAAGASRAVTNNAGVTTGIGLGVQAAAHAGLEYAERRVHETEQNEIAAVAGGLPVGAVATWRAVHDIPIEANEHGEVTVDRAIGGPGFACKAIVFSVDDEEKRGVVRAFYTATVCRDGVQWKWATAEPATERWGALQ